VTDALTGDDRHHDAVTPPDPLPPDPVAYDDPRNVRARAKGLDAPYIAGGDDPDPARGLWEDRHYGRLLIAMVVVLVLGAFVVGFLVALAGPGR
jgi:hypothetical protein